MNSSKLININFVLLEDNWEFSNFKSSFSYDTTIDILIEIIINKFGIMEYLNIYKDKEKKNKIECYDNKLSQLFNEELGSEVVNIYFDYIPQINDYILMI